MQVAFDFYIRFVLAREGWYSNDPNDDGKETFKGISRVMHPHWEGWLRVDMLKATFGTQDAKVISSRFAALNDAMLNDMVETFYYKTFWVPLQCDAIKDTKLAGMVMDWSVNSGEVAVKKLQELLGLKPDGDLGPMTLAAINNATGLYAKFKERRIMFYNAHCKLVQKDIKYLNGWLNRVAAFDEYTNAA